MPWPASSLFSCVLVKQGSTPRPALPHLPAQPLLSLDLGKGWASGIYVLVLAKADHHQPLMPKSLLTYYLTNTVLILAD